MRVLLEVFLLGGGGLLAVGLSAAYILRSKFATSAPDKCEHKRWSPWKIEQQVPIYLYSEVDAGRGIPDRVDVQMTRTCKTCGLPQSKTVRGIDATNYK